MGTIHSFPADDQRVLLRASKLLHRVLTRQGLPHRPERFLIHQLHRTSARGVLCAMTAVVRPFSRPRVSRIAGVERAVRATDDVDEVHASIVAGSTRLGPDRATPNGCALACGAPPVCRNRAARIQRRGDSCRLRIQSAVTP